jgi:hypothetical protein
MDDAFCACLFPLPHLCSLLLEASWLPVLVLVPPDITPFNKP